MNETLKRDITNIRPDAAARLVPAPVHQIDRAIAVEVETLKENFEIYGVPYNEDTVKAALITHIWSTKASMGMFSNGAPPHISPDLITWATQGGLVALNVLFAAHEEFNPIFHQE